MSHPRLLSLGTSGGQTPASRLRSGSRHSRPPFPCPVSPQASAQNPVPDKCAGTKPDPASPTRLAASAQRNIHPVCSSPATHVRRAALPPHLLSPTPLPALPPPSPTPLRSRFLTWPRQPVVPPRVFQNLCCSTFPDAVPQSLVFSWSDHPRFRPEFFRQLL